MLVKMYTVIKFVLKKQYEKYAAKLVKKKNHFHKRQKNSLSITEKKNKDCFKKLVQKQPGH